MNAVFARLAAVAALSFAATAGATDLSASIRIAQPGVYGRIDIGGLPQPPMVVLPKPVIIQPPRVVVAQPQPVYLWVPPGHRKDWRKHCGKYDACGVPVYFVKDDWYDEHVMKPHKRGRGAEAKGGGNGKGKGHGKGRD
ncbi:MAG TPA: hypothetical protein VFR86_26105 [Burkholderiaceae bacterium]|nr:hypothetical protein [Burkholderiaceae bacterium]